MAKEEIINKLKEVGASTTEQIVESVKHSTQIKKVGAILIDTQLKKFKIDVPNNSGGLAKKATLAMLTGGMSVVASAASKGVKSIINKWIPFEELINYEFVANNERETSGAGGRVRIMKGVYAGGYNKVSKSVTKSAKFKIHLNNLDSPYIEIPIISKPLSGKEFDKAERLVEETKSGLEYILRNQ